MYLCIAIFSKLQAKRSSQLYQEVFLKCRSFENHQPQRDWDLGMNFFPTT